MANIVVDPTVPDDVLSQQLVALIDCLRPRIQGGGGDIYASSRAYFSNIYNMPGAREAVQRYGSPNCGSSWIPPFTIYWAAKYFNSYPLPVLDPSNCTTIKTMINALAQEQINLHQMYVEGAGDAEWYKYASIGLNDRATDVQALYARLNCDANINQQVQASDISTLQNVTASLQPPTAASSPMSGILAAVIIVAIGMGLVLLWPSGEK